ncbi:MAG: creatininase family protein [Anaerolineaceae bacterium]|nr:MAG: creatininase family protein [Anaerolineaceae bacterium]
MKSGNVLKHFEMSWPEFEVHAKKTNFAILPVGAIEQHGPHLPMGTDVIIGEYLAERLALATGAILLRSLAYTPSFSCRYYPGTVRVSDDTFTSELVEIAESLYIHGIDIIYVFLSHLGAAAACKAAERKLLLTSKARLVNLLLPGYQEALDKFCSSEKWHKTYVHAEEYETSAMLAIRPDLVDMSKAVKEYPEIDPLLGPISIPWNEFSKSGVVGDATVAKVETGQAILDYIYKKSVEIIQIHQDSLKS